MYSLRIGPDGVAFFASGGARLDIAHTRPAGTAERGAPESRVAVATVAFRPEPGRRGSADPYGPRRAPPQTIKFKKNRPEQPVRGSRPRPPRAPRGVSALAHGARARVSAGGARVQYRPSCEAKNVEAPVPSTDRFLRRAPARPGRRNPFRSDG